MDNPLAIQLQNHEFSTSSELENRTTEHCSQQWRKNIRMITGYKIRIIAGEIVLDLEVNFS